MNVDRFTSPEPRYTGICVGTAKQHIDMEELGKSPLLNKLVRGTYPRGLKSGCCTFQTLCFVTTSYACFTVDFCVCYFSCFSWVSCSVCFSCFSFFAYFAYSFYFSLLLLVLLLYSTTPRPAFSLSPSSSFG